MSSLYQYEIKELKDKELQLQYILGGLYPHGNLNCNIYWGCDIKCSTLPVNKDDKYYKVVNFIKKHNISNSTFLRLARTYLFGHFNSYKGDFGTLIPELDRVLMDYKFTYTNYSNVPENNLNEKQLLDLIEKESNIEGTELNIFLKKYSLTIVDFIILAKTGINYQFKVAYTFEKEDLMLDLQKILKNNNLYQSYEYVKSYREFVEKQNLENDKPKSLIRKIKDKIKI